MAIRSGRLCLVTSTHISANPRLVKEADALVEAGYRVDVVALDMNAQLRRWDHSLLATKPWSIVPVSRGLWISYAIRTLRQRLARFALTFRLARCLRVAEWAHHRLIGPLARAAAEVRADLYIAHNLAALPPAARAAKLNNAKLGFDAEDFHTEELTHEQRNSGDQFAREIIERTLLPRCVHLTAASPMIAEAYREKYGAEMHSILNVFPLFQAPGRPMRVSETVPRSLYWFSQTIGDGRGLDQIIEAIALMKEPAKLFLRGNPSPGYADFVIRLAKSKNVQLEVLKPALADQMARFAASYSIGLSLELNEPSNRAICLTNKIFTYLLGGIPVLLSRTPAQERLASELGDAALLVDLDRPSETARVLSEFLDDPKKQQQARSVAWKLGENRFNWDLEQRRFLNLAARQVSFDA